MWNSRRESENLEQPSNTNSTAAKVSCRDKEKEVHEDAHQDRCGGVFWGMRNKRRGRELKTGARGSMKWIF